MQWLTDNKEWLFQGVAVTVPLALAGGAFSWWKKHRASRESQDSIKPISQSQTAGYRSTNYQAGGNISIGEKGEESDNA